MFKTTLSKIEKFWDSHKKCFLPPPYRILHELPVGIMVLEYIPYKKDFLVNYVNTKALSLLTLNPTGRYLQQLEDLPGHKCSEELPEYNYLTVIQVYKNILRQGTELHRILKFKDKDWGLRYFEHGCVLFGENKLLVTFHDITRSHSIAVKDGLTGLYNRMYLTQQVETALRYVKRDYNQYVYVRVDLDKFKPVNDNYGHLEGDRCLKIVSERLLSACRETDIVARIGGDEFAILMQVMSTSTVSLEQSLIRIYQSLRFSLVSINIHTKEEEEYQMSGSVGYTNIAIGDTTESVDSRADKAQLMSKQSQKIESIICHPDNCCEPGQLSICPLLTSPLISSVEV